MHSKILGIAVVLLLGCGADDDSPVLMVQGQGEGGAFGKQVIIAADGTSYIAGDFQGAISVGECSAVAAGDYDVLVAKLTVDGECVWLRSFGGGGYDSVLAMTFLPDGLILGGSFESSMTIGGTDLVADDTDAWLARFSLSGEPEGAVSVTGPGSQLINDVTASGSGVYVAGEFEQTGAAGTVEVTSFADIDAMLWRFDDVLTAVWAISWGGIGADAATRVDAAADDIHVSGYFFDSMTLGSPTLQSEGRWDAFLALVDANGEGVWSLRVGGPGDDRGASVYSAGSGQALWSGSFTDDLSIGGQQYQNAGFADSFVARVSGTGEPTEVIVLAGDGLDEIWSVAEHDVGVLVTGVFTDVLPVGNGAIASIGSADVFAAQLSWDGVSQWSARLGTASTIHPDTLGDAAVDPSEVWMTGSFSGELTVSGSDDVLSSTDTDLFVIRLPL